LRVYIARCPNRINTTVPVSLILTPYFTILSRRIIDNHSPLIYDKNLKANR